MKSPIASHFAMSAPCNNCPFRVTGGLDLEAGRLDGIVAGLLNDDCSTFQCHKTVHSALGGDWDDGGNYIPSWNESMCVGAMIYMEKIGRPTVAMRIARVTGDYRPDKQAGYYGEIIEPTLPLVR